MDPAVCECVWLMTVGVRVCRLREDEYVRGCVFMWVLGGGWLQGYVFCCDNLYYRLFFNPICLFYIINLNAFDTALMLFLG